MQMPRQVPQASANDYHCGALNNLDRRLSWKRLFICLVKALLAIDMRLSLLVDIQNERNQIIKGEKKLIKDSVIPNEKCMNIMQR